MDINDLESEINFLRAWLNHYKIVRSALNRRDKRVFLTKFILLCEYLKSRI